MWPTRLRTEYEIKNVSLRKETENERSSLWFEIAGAGRIIRIKQFFYDWGTPVVVADTDLVFPGKSFEVDGVIGFFGTDYKGNRAAYYARWFTNVELSVKQGEFSEAEILNFLKALMPFDPSISKRLGERSFTTTSYTARFRKPKWQEDEISRVEWYENTFDIWNVLSCYNIIVPAFSYEEYFLDSVGYNENEKEVEVHFLLRSEINYTDGIWVWIAPKEMAGSLSTIEGDNIGIRQSWNVKKERLSLGEIELDIVICKQNIEHDGWYVHWELDGYVYQLFVRPSKGFDGRKLKHFLHTFNGDEIKSSI